MQDMHDAEVLRHSLFRFVGLVTVMQDFISGFLHRDASAAFRIAEQNARDIELQVQNRAAQGRGDGQNRWKHVNTGDWIENFQVRCMLLAEVADVP